jgi:hypothetical protein
VIFIAITSSLCERTLSFAVSLREESEVLCRRRLNGLSAPAEFQFRREVSSPDFGSLCRLLPPTTPQKRSLAHVTDFDPLL